LCLARPAAAQGLSVSWDLEETVNYHIVVTKSTTHLGPVTVWLDEHRHGLSEPVMPEFHSDTTLSVRRAVRGDGP
jgi:hypothetical protein